MTWLITRIARLYKFSEQLIVYHKNILDFASTQKHAPKENLHKVTKLHFRNVGEMGENSDFLKFSDTCRYVSTC